MAHYQVQDRFFKKAKQEGFRARSVFKLEGIDERYHVLRPGMKVLDLGAAPGSFLQYISHKIGSKGLAIGIDLQPIVDLMLDNVTTYVGDIFNEAIYEEISQKNNVRQFDLITSDLAPKTTGISFVDGNASLELNLQVLSVAKRYLRKGGNLIMKTLPGFNEGSLIGEVRKNFKQVRKFRPEAIRKSSGECYVIGLGKN